MAESNNTNKKRRGKQQKTKAQKEAEKKTAEEEAAAAAAAQAEAAPPPAAIRNPYEDWLLVVFTIIVATFVGFSILAEKRAAALPPKDIMVIGAALPGTGTLVLTEALERLGLQPYHLWTVTTQHKHLNLWHNFTVEQEGSLDKILDLVAKEQYTATLDAPSCNYYKELLKRYPNAKVILPTIEPHDLKLSMTETLYPLATALEVVPFTWIEKTQKIRECLSAFMSGYDPLIDENTQLLPDPDHLPTYYQEYMEEVKANVPAEQLLLFKPQDGYQALCKFLAPASSQPLPEGEETSDDDFVLENCRQILHETHEPYPPKKQSPRTLLVALQAIHYLALSAPVLGVVASFGITYVVTKAQQNKSKQE